MNTLALHITAVTMVAFSSMGTAQTMENEWLHSITGTGNENASKIVATPNGDLYSVGTFSDDLDLDPGTDEYLVSNNSGVVASYIQKLDAQGNFIWGKSINSDTSFYIASIHAAADGDLLCYGSYSGASTLIHTSDSDQLTTTGQHGTFVLRLGADGTFKWVTNFDSPKMYPEHIHTERIIEDHNQDIIICGSFVDTIDLDPGTNEALSITQNGAHALFISKLNSNGDYQWSKVHDASSNWGAFAHDVAVKQNNSIILTGYALDSIDLDSDPVATNYEYVGPSGAFLLHLGSDGSFINMASLYNDALGPVAETIGIKVVVDENDDIYWNGTFYGDVDFDPGLGEHIVFGDKGIFTVKLNPDFSLVWFDKILATNSFTYPVRELIVTPDHKVAMVGSFGGEIQFSPNSPGGSNILSIADGIDGFYRLLDANGSFDELRLIGGAQGQMINGATCDQNGFLFINGFYTNEADVYPGQQLTANNPGDGITARLSNILNISEGHLTDFDTYPNPALEHLKITAEFNKFKGKVTDASGQTVEAFESHASTYLLNLSDYTSGVYFIHVSDGKNTLVRKIIKQ